MRRPWAPALAFTGVVLATVWLTLAAYVGETRASIAAEADQELSNALNVIRSHTSRVYQHAKMMLSVADDWVGSQPADAPFDSFNRFSILIRRVQEGAGDNALPIGLVNGAGNGLWREPRPSLAPGTYVGDRDYIAEQLSQPAGTFFIGKPILSRTDGKKSLPISLRLHANHLAVRYAVTNITERNFSSIFAHLTDIVPSTAGLVRSDGTLLFVWPINEQLKGRRISGFTDILARGGMNARNIDILPGIEEAGALRTAFSKVDDDPLVVFVGMRTEDLQDKLFQEVMLPTGMALLATVVIGSMGCWLATLMRRRGAEAEELTKALSRAEAANDAKAHFLANMSHELRTPLNAIIGFSDVMRGELFGPLGNKSYRTYAQDIADAGRHLLEIISQILETAKLESGTLTDVAVACELADHLPACLRLLADRAAPREVRLLPCLLVDLPPLLIDPVHLRQILLNLIGNAIKFSHHGGTVEIDALVQPNRMLRVEIRDHGIGIKPEHMAELFKPFSQVEKSLSRLHGGVGLGLVNTRRLVEAYGGRIYLESVYGQGTSAIIELPTAS